MKKKILTTTALVCLFMVCLAAVADLSGKWSGILKGPDGNDYPLSYTFKLDGDKLTGVASGPQGETAITNAKVNGADFTFNIDVNGMDVPHTCKYYAAGDSIALGIDYGGAKLHTTLKRDDKK